MSERNDNGMKQDSAPPHFPGPAILRAGTTRRGVGRAGALYAAFALFAVLLGLSASPTAAAPSFEVELRNDANEVQRVSVRATAGEFRLSFGTGGPGVSETADIPAMATATQVQSALNAIANISSGGGAVSVSGNNNGGYRVTFGGGPLAGTDVPEMAVADGTTPLSGGSSAATVATLGRAGVGRSDQRVDYTVDVTNLTATSPPLPHTAAAAGDALACAGAKPPRNWLPIAPNTPDKFRFEWRRNGAVIPGEASVSYTPSAADAGQTIQCLVTGENQNAAVTFVSLPAVVVDPQPATAPPAPASATVAASRPTVSGTGSVVGTSTRTCSTASMNWTGSPTYTFQWLRNGVPITDAVDATTATHTVVAGDINKVLQCRVVGTNSGGSLVGISNGSPVGTVSAPPNLLPGQTPAIVVDPTTVVIELPGGNDTYVFKTTHGTLGDNGNWSCVTQPAVGVQPAEATCVSFDVLAPGGSYPPLNVAAALGADTPEAAVATATVSGGGGSSELAVASDGFIFGPAVPFGIAPGSFMTEVLDPVGGGYTEAGGHPFSVGAAFTFSTYRKLNPGGSCVECDRYVPTKHVKRIVTDTPRGFVGNARAVPELCPSIAEVNVNPSTCPAGSVVGGISLDTTAGTFTDLAVYAIEPELGVPAQFAFVEGQTQTTYTFAPRLRPEDGYAITIEAAPALENIKLYGVDVTLCSFGAKIRPEGAQDRFSGCKEASDADANQVPLVTLPPQCEAQPPTTRLSVDSWETPGVFASDTFTDPPLTGCDQVQFDPQIDLQPTSGQADSASGLDVNLSIPSEGLEDPNGVAQAHLKKTVVELPEGMSVNPSAATGLEGCTDVQLGLKTDSEPACPDGSTIATVEATTPVLEETLTGKMVLRTPKSTEPLSGEMFRMALVVRNVERGILIKLPGSAVADPQTGRLTATFDDNPQLPIGEVTVRLKGGQRGVLAMPQDCGQMAAIATLTPWGAPSAMTQANPFEVGGNCGLGFAPQLAAGMSTRQARANGTFSFKFTREDGEQWVDGLTAALPPGLLASVKGLPLCSDRQAQAGECPAGSRIGTVDGAAGSGTPFVLERKGDAYLTEGYKGCPYGLAIVVPVIAGPFDGSSAESDLGKIVIRQKVCVDRSSAQVTATSDPIPTIWHGIPLRIRSATVNVDRPGFMLNPSGCDAKQVGSRFDSARDAVADAAVRFQAAECSRLKFKPRLGLRLTGRKQVRTGKHPGVKALVRQTGTIEAGIEKAVVRLPKSLALDPDNAQALCEFEAGTKPDLENHCPKGSIVGRARAKTPLLNRDLVGNVYFVKNVRTDPKTGNTIRTLPMIIVALRGEIAINLKGHSSTTKTGKLVNTFANVPDAPINQFNLNIKGGRNGILTVTRTRRAKINLCARPKSHIAEADMDGQNGKRFDRNVRMNTPCANKKRRAAVRRHAAAKRRGAVKRKASRN